MAFYLGIAWNGILFSSNSVIIPHVRARIQFMWFPVLCVLKCALHIVTINTDHFLSVGLYTLVFLMAIMSMKTS